MGRPIKSGHCNTPQTAKPQESHDRCERMGGGTLTKSTGRFHPCYCHCHLGETFECGGCGRPIREAPLWPNMDEPEEMTYVHVDASGDALTHMDGDRAVADRCAG